MRQTWHRIKVCKGDTPEDTIRIANGLLAAISKQPLQEAEYVSDLHYDNRIIIEIKSYERRSFVERLRQVWYDDAPVVFLYSLWFTIILCLAMWVTP